MNFSGEQRKIIESLDAEVFPFGETTTYFVNIDNINVSRTILYWTKKCVMMMVQEGLDEIQTIKRNLIKRKLSEGQGKTI